MKKSKVLDIIEWGILIILLAIIINNHFLSYANFSSIEAHKQSERTSHYGPSEIIKEIDLDGYKIYLCRYKEWFSADTVVKRGFMWYPGSGVGGRKIKENEKVTFTWSSSRVDDDRRMMRIAGYVSDPKISTVKLRVKESDNIISLKYTIDESRMFIYYWNEFENDYKPFILIGYDDKGNKIYESDMF